MQDYLYCLERLMDFVEYVAVVILCIVCGWVVFTIFYRFMNNNSKKFQCNEPIECNQQKEPHIDQGEWAENEEQEDLKSALEKQKQENDTLMTWFIINQWKDLFW